MALLRTWEEIAQFLGCNERTARRKKTKLLKAKAIFFQKSGRPPRRTVFAHTEALQRFIYAP